MEAAYPTIMEVSIVLFMDVWRLFLQGKKFYYFSDDTNFWFIQFSFSE